MSKTPQSRPSLLERLYYRDPTRAKVYRQRMLLWESDPQALADAGQRELAAIAAALKHDPAAQPERWVECYEADEQMDQAADLLRSGRWQVARPLLAAAAKAYRVAGESRLWDLADAVWNLGYTYSAVGLPRDAMVSLRAAARLLRLQMRFRDWTRCTASLLMVRTAGLEETPDGRVTELIRLCKVFGWARGVLATGSPHGLSSCARWGLKQGTPNPRPGGGGCPANWPGGNRTHRHGQRRLPPGKHRLSKRRTCYQSHLPERIGSLYGYPRSRSRPRIPRTGLSVPSRGLDGGRVGWDASRA